MECICFVIKMFIVDVTYASVLLLTISVIRTNKNARIIRHIVKNISKLINDHNLCELSASHSLMFKLYLGAIDLIVVVLKRYAKASKRNKKSKLINIVLFWSLRVFTVCKNNQTVTFTACKNKRPNNTPHGKNFHNF